MSYYAECNLFNYSCPKRTASERIVRRELFKLLYHYQSVVLIMKKYNFMHKEFDEREREKIVTYSSHLRNLSQGVLFFTLLVGKIVYRTTHDLLIDGSKFSRSLHVYLVECLMLVISTISMQFFLISLRSVVHRILSIVIPQTVVNDPCFGTLCVCCTEKSSFCGPQLQLLLNRNLST